MQLSSVHSRYNFKDMITKLIGIKEFRKNLAAYTKKAKKGEWRIIVLKKNVPVFEVKPVSEKQIAFEKLAEEIKEAREQVKRGELIPQEEIMKEFGLL